MFVGRSKYQHKGIWYYQSVMKPGIQDIFLFSTIMKIGYFFFVGVNPTLLRTLQILIQLPFVEIIALWSHTHL